VSNGSGAGSRAGRGGRTKSGKPRAGSGGQGRRKLEGKGPTPPARMRPGHPAQRKAQPASGGGTRGGGSRGAEGPGGRSRGANGTAGWSRAADGSGVRSRGAGDAPEVVAGRNPVLEALRAGVPAAALYAAPRVEPDERVGEAIGLAAGLGIPLIETGRAELDRLTGGSVHQGLALRIRPYDYAHPADLTGRARAAGEQPLIVALDGVTDPRNLGAIVRSAAAFGGHGVLVPARRSAGVTAGAWKASAGALARVPVAQAPNLARALVSYQEEGLFVVGLHAGGGADIDGIEVADSPLVLVVGSEGRGLSRLVTDRCDLLARIPMAPGAESLNASVAAGIALHEVAARRAAARSRG
jgi:23S rRNA (guanosine2251-2'-O)-methyltransferase